MSTCGTTRLLIWTRVLPLMLLFAATSALPAKGQDSGLRASPNRQGYYRCWACNGRGYLPSGAKCWSCNGSGIKNVQDMNSRNVARDPYIPANGPNNNPGMQSCFIATAAYGSPWEEHVLMLRQFREQWLLTNAPGRWLTERYYTLSPPLASVIRDRPWARGVTRCCLTPVVVIAGALLGDIGDIA